MWSFTGSARNANRKRKKRLRRLFMCIDHSIHCACGKNHASFNFKDGVLPHEVIMEVFCPECSQEVSLDSATMLSDNGWIISYDMDMARCMLQRVAPPHVVTPGYVFDEGY